MVEQTASWLGKPPFAHDAFISYAHLDNEPDSLGDQYGWVDHFHYSLQTSLRKTLGSRRVSVWHDPKLRVNESFSDQLLETLDGVAVLIPIVSPGYTESEWCRKELEKFLEQARRTGEANKRVFPIIKTDVAISERPEVLQERVGLDFFRKSGQFSTSSLDPTNDETKRYYFDLVNDLSGQIRDFLKNFKATLTGEESPSVSFNGTVFLAEAVPRLRDERERIRRDLEDRGYRVLPDQVEPPDNGSGYDEWVKSRLNESQLIVQLMSSNGVPEAWEGADRLRLQDEAFQRFSSLSDVLENETLENLRSTITDLLDNVTAKRLPIQRIVWREPGGQRDVPITIKKDDEPEAGPDPRPPFSDPGIQTVTPASVYVICDNDDMANLESIGEFLYENGLDVRFPAFGGGDDKPRDEQKWVLDAHRTKLAECDGFVVYYGHGSDAWMDANLSQIKKAAAHRDKPIRARLVYLGPPAVSEKERQFGFRRDIKVVQSPPHLIEFVHELVVVERGAQ